MVKIRGISLSFFSIFTLNLYFAILSLEPLSGSRRLAMELKIEVSGGTIILPPNEYFLREDLGIIDEEIKIFNSHKRYLSAILRKDGRKTRVNFFEFAKIIKFSDYRIRHEIERYINLVLIVLDVLTENQENAWTFSDAEMNPEWGVSSSKLFDTIFMGRAYFVNKEDIIDYASANWKGRTGWTIFQMKNVLKKEEVC